MVTGDFATAVSIEAVAAPTHFFRLLALDKCRVENPKRAVLPGHRYTTQLQGAITMVL